jgi:nucleoside 2-deoxyribosyltransferase
MSEVKEEKTCEALDKYMQPYREGKKKIYMAGPLFNEGDRYTNKLNSDALREKGYTTFLPQEVVITKDSSELVKAACFYMDLKAIRECDILIANCNGIEIDSGTAAEIGLGYGWNKRMIVYKSDVRNYYNEVFRLNNFVGGLTDNKVCSTLEEVLQMVSALKFEE